MILVDSSVWIDYFSGTGTPETDKLDEILGVNAVVIGDLILTEFLQGFRRSKDYETALTLFDEIATLEILGVERAIKSANNFRALRKKGITVRKTADVIAATFCIEQKLPLLRQRL